MILGFEQANKYTVLDQDGNVVALLAEDMGGLGKEVGRQFLRTRRSFTATILSPDGDFPEQCKAATCLSQGEIHKAFMHLSSDLI